MFKKQNQKKKEDNKVDVEGKKKIMNVAFVPHTEKSKLAKRLRGKLGSLEKLGNLKMKIVEKTGEKLAALLHRRNTWGDIDCNREDCVIC